MLDELKKLISWKESAPEKKKEKTPKLEVLTFNRDYARVIAEEGRGCQGVSIVEYDGDRFRIEDRPNGKGFIVATTRNKRIFKCRACGGLDVVDKCRFCGSTDIAVFILAQTS